MPDELLPFYERELAYVRQLGAGFAAAHPKIAGRLRLGADSVDDPHVARLIEAFAYIAARIRYKLDDDFPELTDALLGVLYPHYLAPIPSMAVAQLLCQPGLTEPYTVPSGTMLETEPVEGEACHFRTCYPTELWPIEVADAGLRGAPVVAPVHPDARGAMAVLRLTLRCTGEDKTFAELGPDALRFFLKGQHQHVFALYELIFNHAIGVAVADGPGDPAPLLLDSSCLRPVGFERDEGMLPYPPQSFHGYRLLTEFFAFPSKFMFVDVTEIGRKTRAQDEGTLDLFVYLDRAPTELEQNLSSDMFTLGCTPIVNLFRHTAEPIELTHSEPEYRVVPDARRPNAMEVYSIDRVTALSPNAAEVEYRPFYAFKHNGEGAANDAFWHGARRAADETRGGTEHFLNLVDLDFEPVQWGGATLTVETTCLNRDLPNRLPFGGGRPQLRLVEGKAPLAAIACLTPPTPTVRPALRNGARWRLVSHLTLNHLSISDGEEGTAALREILKLYDFRDSPESRAIIDGIVSVTSRPVSARAPSRGVGAFGRGTEIDIEFDEAEFAGNSVFLFASVLERFMPLYASINSFTSLTATVKGREEALRKWPPRLGDIPLL